MKKRIISVIMAVTLLFGVTPVAAETTEVIQNVESVINHGEMELSPEQAEIICDNYLAFANDPELVAEDIIINYYE